MKIIKLEDLKAMQHYKKFKIIRDAGYEPITTNDGSIMLTDSKDDSIDLYQYFDNTFAHINDIIVSLADVLNVRIIK